MLGRTTRNATQILQHQHLQVRPSLIHIRNFADVKKSTSAPTSRKYNKYKRPHKSQRSNERELSYAEEADLYILKELRKEINEFKGKNQNIKGIVSQFEDVLSLYGFEIVKGPLPYLNSFFEEAIHLRKVQGDLTFDLLVDYKISEIETKEVQLTIRNENNSEQLLYLLGDFTKEQGFTFNYAMIIYVSAFEYIAAEFTESLCSGDNIVFKKLNNHYQKELHINDPRVVEFLIFDGKDYDLLPDMDGRLLIDTLINYMVIENLGVKVGNQDGNKLRAIIWMLGTYCENTLYGKWLSDLELFIKE